MTFAAAAVRYSDSPNALEGGDLGWRGLDEIPPAFAGMLAAMKPGQVIGPIRGPSGFQLLQLVETRAAGQRSKSPSSRPRILVTHRRPGRRKPRASKAETLRGTHRRLARTSPRWPAESPTTPDQAPRRRPGLVRRQHLGHAPSASRSQRWPTASSRRRSRPTWAGTSSSAPAPASRTSPSENRRTQVREIIGQRKAEEEWNASCARCAGKPTSTASGGSGRALSRRCAPGSPWFPASRPASAPSCACACPAGWDADAGRYRRPRHPAARCAGLRPAAAPCIEPGRRRAARRARRCCPGRRPAPTPLRPRRSGQCRRRHRVPCSRRARPASMANSTAWSPARCTRPRSTTAASPTPAPPNCWPRRPAATW